MAHKKKINSYYFHQEENISKLRKVNCTKVDTATFTGDNILPEVSLINENQIEEINKLEKEIERLKALELNKSQEILKLEFEYQSKFCFKYF